MSTAGATAAQPRAGRLEGIPRLFRVTAESPRSGVENLDSRAGPLRLPADHIVVRSSNGESDART